MPHARRPSHSRNHHRIARFRRGALPGTKEIAVQEFPSDMESMILRVESIDDDSPSIQRA
jgi:hypothetical protein